MARTCSELKNEEVITSDKRKWEQERKLAEALNLNDELVKHLTTKEKNNCSGIAEN